MTGVLHPGCSALYSGMARGPGSLMSHMSVKGTRTFMKASAPLLRRRSTRHCRMWGSGKTLKVRTLGCAQSSFPPTDPRPSSLRSHGRTRRTHNTERREVYTGSGHRCGVIPYSSVWCGGLPLGLMMMSNTRKKCLARVCSWLGG